MKLELRSAVTIRLISVFAGTLSRNGRMIRKNYSPCHEVNISFTTTELTRIYYIIVLTYACWRFRKNLTIFKIIILIQVQYLTFVAEMLFYGANVILKKRINKF